MNRTEIIEKLRNDEHYYGEFGKQYLSNSDINTLLTRPDKFRNEEREETIPFVLGKYLHTIILEPDKVDSFKIVDSSTRNTKKYKEAAGNEIVLLEKEVDMMHRWKERIYGIDFFKHLLTQGNIEYEVPGIVEIDGVEWKGKADCINHDEQLIIDLKTTSSLDNFKWNAPKYGYDSQAYIYSKMFGYPMAFVVIDKTTEQVGFFTTSDKFLWKGQTKVENAAMAYKDWLTNPDYYRKEYFHEGIL